MQPQHNMPMKEHGKHKKKEKRFLGPTALVFSSVNTGSWRISRPQADESLCARCGRCEMFCPTGVIEVHKEKDVQKVIEIDWNYCKGCGICAEVCPKKCIQMVKEKNE